MDVFLFGVLIGGIGGYVLAVFDYRHAIRFYREETARMIQRQQPFRAQKEKR
jgi:hypothetical protein